MSDDPLYQAEPTARPAVIDWERRYRELESRYRQLIGDAERFQQSLMQFRSLELQLLKANSLAELISILLSETGAHFSLDRVHLYLIDSEDRFSDFLGDKLQPLCDSGLIVLSTLAELAKLFPETTVPCLQSRKLDEAGLPHWPDEINSHATLPLRRHGSLIGLLNLGSKDVERFNPDYGMDLLEHFASMIALCIENNISQENLRQLSLRDPLTQAWNRRYLDKALREELERAHQLNYPLSCMLIDLDHFKTINDTYGHAMGDKALVEITRILRTQVRQSDVIARYGGEEFAILLPGCPKEHALMIAQSICSQTSKTVMKNTLGQSFSLTLSVGVSAFTPQDSERPLPRSLPTHLFLEADEALYQAKRNGRNQAVMATPHSIRSSNEVPTTRTFG
ncbi:hypothetical protein C4K68_15430 [Pokkaliibacter plantistimulans]|uniref:diguanylate cyclase n=1 Tax=Proteobacteria bacterium 228 TaxID=2083153 RepID=A0A2S5KNG1_9PROT|nr:sensor domain-containing diguanylate cyclase [Pokkaliibacter plantistimulans]PPC76351.1 hypothetical protein C4K68_15430 [Pokkaliibacter plantistimulans]